MIITYDDTADALYIQFQRAAKVKQTLRIRDGIMVDIGKNGKIFGIEVLDASRKVPIAELGKLSINLPVHAA